LVLAMAMAGYLAWASLSGGSVAGCGPESGCDKVLQSRWAYWLGIPVSVPALVVYAGLLAATFGIRSGVSTAHQKRTWSRIIVLSALVIGAAVWFVALQVFVLKSVCPFCMTAHASGLVAGLIFLWSVPIQSANTKGRRPDTQFAATASMRNQLAFAGALGVAVLAVGQTLVTKQRHQVKSVGASAPVNASKNESRVLPLHGGQFQLPVADLPMIGSSAAPNIMVSLFDYTCHHCRDMHGLLLQAQQSFSNQLGIVNLPMPLDANCNYLMIRTPSAHVNACEYAKLGLAVWWADREALPKFDAWLFEPASPKPLAEVKQYAEDLVGREKLANALTNAWLSSQIQTNVAIYNANRRTMTNGSMPQLIIGQAISIGPMDSVDQLYALLAEQFGLKRTPSGP
jgi:uncharacterized membrane protein